MDDYTKLALLDLDGVLCDDGHRVQFALDRLWVSYFGLIPGDSVWPKGRELYDNLTLCGYDIAYLTGRREDTRKNTEDWLEANLFDHTLPLIMRRFNDRRPLGEFKASVVWWVAELYDEVTLWDDDPSVIEEVQKKIGANYAVHCDWYKKPPKMIRKARA